MVAVVIPAPVAAGFDWIEGLLPLLFLVFWIVSNIVNVIRKVAAGAGPKPGEPRPVPPRRPPPAGAAPAPAGDARELLERQIEEFLRGGRPGNVAEAPRPIVVTKPERERKKKDRSQRPPTRDPAPRGAKPSQPPHAPPPVADRHLSGLGDTGADVARHVKEAFADHLGHLAPSITGAAQEAGAVAAPAPAVIDVQALLRNPKSMRQMMILREVLDRPVDRW